MMWAGEGVQGVLTLSNERDGLGGGGREAEAGRGLGFGWRPKYAVLGSAHRRH